MAQTIRNGDATSFTIPQAIADLSGTVAANQLPGGAPTGSGAIVMAASPTLTGTTTVSILSAKRINSHAGTALVTGDFAASSGWGTSPTITVNRGTDQGASVQITAKATTAANPTLTLTFHDGTWTTVPIVVCGRTELVAATGAPAAAVTNEFVPTTVSATQVVFTFNGTPVANSNYGFSFIAIGT